MLGLRRLAIQVSCLLAFSSLASATDVTGTLRFVGITPCRMADTRGIGGFTGQAGPPALIANANRTFQITGTVPGIPLQCGIPTNAQAISVNFTATGFFAAGDLRVFPAGGALPLTSILNYSLENIANATTVPLGPSGGGENGITIRADASATDFVIDVNGYYVATPVEYDAVFIQNQVSAPSQCADWNSFRTGLGGGTFSRITLFGSAGGPVSCGTGATVAQMVGALAYQNPFNLVVTCDGRDWIVTSCPSSRISVSISNGPIAATGACGCSGVTLALRPCSDTVDWGGLGGGMCGAGAVSQNIKLRLER